MFEDMYNVSQKNLLGKTGWYFSKLCLNYKISYISTSFKKEIIDKIVRIFQKSCFLYTSLTAISSFACKY